MSFFVLGDSGRMRIHGVRCITHACSKFRVTTRLFLLDCISIFSSGGADANVGGVDQHVDNIRSAWFEV